MRLDYERQQKFAPYLRSSSSPVVELHSKLSVQDRTRFHNGLLDWIGFGEIDTRQDKISAAYRRTFEWLFSDPQESKWSDFPRWLMSDAEQLYWITGKPASGKSTLVKFIYRDERTMQHLKQWAKRKKLIICSYYFWNSGTHMQMSEEGMARTLLHHALRQAPDLWASLFPYQMEEYIAYGNPWHHQITWDDMMRAFRVLVEGAGKDYKLFFLIDGLDEFDGEHEKLIDMLQGFLSPHVKTCVSSRPWNVFQDRFQQRPSLRLEDITYDDIKHYVSSRMSESIGFKERQMETPQEAAQLIENITIKASGVWLWVALVTDSLLEGLAEGERLSELQARLNDELNDIGKK